MEFQLGVGEFVAVEEGAFSLCISTPFVDGVERRVIKNAALLVCSIEDESGAELARLQSVVAVDEREGVMHRTIFSPFQ